MSRFFAFGCSFTKYVYPTYADLLCFNFDWYQNWGQGGAGNHYIFNSLVEADQRHKFNKNDTIVVQWTNTAREDRYLDKSWIGDGNIYSQNTYDSKWVKKFITERGCLIRDMAFIKAAFILLKNSCADFRFISMVPIHKHNEWIDTEYNINNDIFDLYKEVIEQIRPSYYEVIYNKNWSPIMQHETGTRDSHPSPNEHLTYIKKILPEFTISEKIIDFAEEQTAKFFAQDPTYFRHKTINRL